MDQKQLEAFAREAAKNLKTEADLNNFSQMLTKITVESALNAALDDHIDTVNTVNPALVTAAMVNQLKR